MEERVSFKKPPFAEMNMGAAQNEQPRVTRVTQV